MPKSAAEQTAADHDDGEEEVIDDPEIVSMKRINDLPWSFHTG